MIVYGLNPVLEALRAGRVDRLRVTGRHDARVEEIVRAAAEAGVSICRVDRRVLDQATGGGAHQGVVADARAPADYSVSELVRSASGHAPLLVVLDGIEDPHNVGAILRTVDAVGADGVVRQARHAAPLGPAVVNIARALDELREAGVWTVGLAADAPVSYDAVDFRLPTAIVLGAEGTGLRRLVRERCDVLAGVPMSGRVDSLNVSVAAGVVLFEAVRQRRPACGGHRR
jgi:23S rRNA (guanosine2251-2'-O)-methyltransferase